MIQREVIPSLEALLKCLARFVEGHQEWSALVTGVNGLEESFSPPPAGDGSVELDLPPGEDQADRPVSALKRRWTLLSDAALDWTAGVLYKLHLRKWGSAVEDRCPAESVEFCSVCSARELVSLSLFCDDQTLCVTCFRRVLHRANRGRSQSEPQLTPAFLAELLGLHRVPYWRLDEERARERTEADVRSRIARLQSIGTLELRVMHRWAVAIAPVAMVLQPMTRSLSALLADPGAAECE